MITQKLTFMKSGGFHVNSTYKTYKLNISRKTFQFYGVLWEGYVMFSHEIRRISREIHRISKDQLPGMVSPILFTRYFTDVAHMPKQKVATR